MSELRALARGVPGASWRRIINKPDIVGPTLVTAAPPSGHCWQLLSVSFQLTLSGEVGDRQPVLLHQDASQAVLFSSQAPAAYAPSKSPTVSWNAGLGAPTAQTDVSLAMPLPTPMYLFPGEQVSFFGTIDAADEMSGIRVVVIETLIGNEAFEANAEQSIVDHWNALFELYNEGRVH